MKKTILLLIALAGFNLLFAQEENKTGNSEIQTLFSGDGITDHGFYGGLNLYYGGMGTGSDYRSAFVSGLRAAWVMDHVFELGFDANGIVSESKSDPLLDDDKYFYSGGFGGVYMAFNLFPQKPVNISIPLTIGGGGISYVGNYYDYGENTNYYPERVHAFFMVQPGVELQLNLLKFMRVSMHASYRLTSNIYSEYNMLPEAIGDENIVRGLNAGVSLKFGSF